MHHVDVRFGDVLGESVPAVSSPRCDAVEQRQSHGGALESEPAQLCVDDRQSMRERGEACLLERGVIATQKNDADLLEATARLVFTSDEATSREARLSW